MVKSVLVPASTALLGALAIGGCAAQNHGASGASGGPAAAATAPVGVFVRVRDAPPAFAGVSGSAELTAGPDGGSDVSISLRGLRPNVTYIAHVHQGTCDQPDAGGPHFKFDPDGPGTPPNEIHLRFAANATGGASAQAHSKRAVPNGAAGSIVMHEDAPGQAAGAGAGESKAPAGHEHHAGGSAGDATAGGAAGHSHAAKIACAALRERDHSDVPSSTAPAGRPADGETLAIRVSADEPVGGVQKLTVRKGDRVQFTVTSDQPEEVHTHGYDITANVSPATPARFDFPAETGDAANPGPAKEASDRHELARRDPHAPLLAVAHDGQLDPAADHLLGHESVQVVDAA
jgi:hypothetical protein